jgi:uncharacterized membrane protein
MKITRDAIEHDNRVFPLAGITAVNVIERAARTPIGNTAYLVRIASFSLVGVGIACFAAFVLINQVDRMNILYPIYNLPVLGEWLYSLDLIMPIIVAIIGVAFVVRGFKRVRSRAREFGVELVGNGKRPTLFYTPHRDFAEAVRGAIMAAMADGTDAVWTADVERRTLDKASAPTGVSA